MRTRFDNNRVAPGELVVHEHAILATAGGRYGAELEVGVVVREVVLAREVHSYARHRWHKVDASTFLPHMTIGVTRKEHDPVELRTALLPLRSVKLRVGEVTELSHIRFPAGLTTLMQPWTVIETVPLSQYG